MKLRYLFIAAFALVAVAMYVRTPAAPVASSAVQKNPVDSIWVGRSDQSRSCENGSGVTLETMATSLSKNGIVVYRKEKIHDDQMRIQSCGTEKGDMNGFLISKKDADKAISAGFVILNPQPKL